MVVVRASVWPYDPLSWGFHAQEADTPQGLNQMQALNLNHLAIPDDGYGETSLEDHSLETEGVSVYFRDLERHLIEHIEKADYVFGCVAWLTHPNILRALAKKKGVSIAVQKEDFLRPDLGDRNGWPTALRRLYDGLPNTISRFE